MKAFPTTKPLDSWGDPNAGMDLRDYFAAKALQGLVVDLSIDCRLEIKQVTDLSYLLADAMMKARQQ